MRIDDNRFSLQLALDVLDLDSALAICRESAEFFDVIEIGTPLIKSIGVKSIASIRAEFPDKCLIADMKTIDTGTIDAAIAFAEGADGVIFQASAPAQTVDCVIQEAKARSKICMIDSLGIVDMQKFERIAEATGADFAIVHTGIDEQRAGFRPLDRLKRIVSGGRLKKLAVAGGIDTESLSEILTVLPMGVIIVGAFVTKSREPRNVARSLRDIVDAHMHKL